MLYAADVGTFSRLQAVETLTSGRLGQIVPRFDPRQIDGAGTAAFALVDWSAVLQLQLEVWRQHENAGRLLDGRKNL